MPVACVLAGKNARYSFERQPRPNDRSIVDIHIIVEIDEVKMNGLTENGQTKAAKNQTYTDSELAYVTTAWQLT
jgi:hypothetical protein